MSAGLSVVMPTHDRAATLRRTLEAMARVDRTGLDAEVVVVANACRDDTEAVVASFADRLPVRCLVEPRPGKSRAVNRGFEDPGLREVVVCTDDDVTPAPGWLQAIAGACQRWPDHAVFGGRIDVVWPQGRVPGWARDSYVQEFGFTVHHYAERECVYDPRRVPYGPNFWLRRSVIEAGWRFPEAVGPHPKNRIICDETYFLRSLQAAGYAMVYCPEAAVGHRIQPEVLTAPGILARAYDLGRGVPYLHGVPRPELLRRYPWVWQGLRLVSVARDAARVALARAHLSEEGRVFRGIHAMRDLGYNVEALRIARMGDAAPPPAAANREPALGARAAVSGSPRAPERAR